MLMSLRAQLQAPQGNTRPIIAAQLNTDNLHDASRCNVLLWVPRSNGSQFLAGHASGNIIVYKKVSKVYKDGENRVRMVCSRWHVQESRMFDQQRRTLAVTGLASLAEQYHQLPWSSLQL